MRFEAMDRRITIQAPQTTLDAAGQPVESWADVATVWAEVKPFRGGERFLARQVVGQAVTTFIIRYRAGITVQHRIVYEGAAWNILDVRERGRQDALELDATARSD